MTSGRRTELDHHTLRTRVNRTILEVHNNFIETKDAKDLYFEYILNCFIALVQYPVNFTIFRHEKKRLVPISHFCTDKEHQRDFENFLKSSKFSSENTFSLFPEVLRSPDPEYSIGIFLMHTKNLGDEGKFTVIRQNPGKKRIHSVGSYIAAAALEFFTTRWRSHDTYFREQMRDGIESSLAALEKNHNWVGREEREKFPPPAEDIWSWQRKAPLPNSDISDWKKKLENLFRRPFRDSAFGLQVSSRILHPKEHGVEYPDEKKKPLNMLVGYRTFTRNNEQLRAENNNGGYAYDISFLVPENSKHKESYTRYFQELKSKFYGVVRTKRTSGTEKFHNPKEQRCLYSKLFSLKKNNYSMSKTQLNHYIKIATVIDKAFWKVLEQEDGVEKIIDCLKSSIGNARSFLDPCMSTGLILINKIFELGGLDRVPVDDLRDVKKLEDFPENIRNDLLRIVSVYYLFSGMASWAGPRGEYNPRNIAAIIVPTKMRGATWCATVHATYMDDSQDYFLSDYIWLSSFLTMTSMRRKNQTMFDGILWENVKARVTSLLVRHIGEGSHADFEEAVQKTVNDKLAGEQRLLPYALPRFSLSVGNGFPNEDANEIEVPLLSGEYIRFSWEIEGNRLYRARQNWTKTGTRNFRNAVHLGARQGIELMTDGALNPRKKRDLI